MKRFLSRRWTQVYGRHQPLSSLRYFSVNTQNVPGLGDSVSEGALANWNKNVGDWCDVDDIVVQIETDKVVVDIRAESAGVLTEQLAEIDDSLEVGVELFKIDTAAEKPAGAGASAPAAKPVASETPKAAPAATPPPKPAAKPPQQLSSTEAPTQSGNRNERRVPMTRMRLAIARRMNESQEVAAALTTFQDCDMSNLMALRSKHKDAFLEKHGVKLGFMSAFVKASTGALLDVPAVNAYIEGKETVYHDYVDISVAVASPNGLVVPVLRNTEEMSFAGVEKAIQDFGRRAKDGSLALEDMMGGTFTISNGGVFGNFFGTPIINQPQSAVLGMHGINQRPVVVDGQVVARPMMYLALTYDHRIVDGREAALFLRKIKDGIEDPARLLLDV